MKKKLTWILTLLAFLLLIPQESKAVDEVETGGDTYHPDEERH